MTEVEELLRRTFQAHEPPAGAADGLAAGARRAVRDRRRRRLAVAGTISSVCAVVAGAVLVAGLRSGPDDPTNGAAGPLVGAPGGAPPPAGWRVESSLGVEVAVPGDWVVNDYGCHQTGASTVVRAEGAALACLTPEPPGKQVVVIGYDRALDLPGVAPQPPADRGEVRLPDGRFAAWVYVPSRNVIVSARTRDAALTRRIIGTVHAVDVDSRGCQLNRPAVDWRAPTRPAKPVQVPAGPDAASLCYYGDDPDIAILQTSVGLTGADLNRLVATLNAAPAGQLPDVPQDCADDRSAPNVLLSLRYPDQDPVLLQISFTSCVGRTIEDGTGHQSQPTERLGELLAQVLHVGVGWHGDLPR